MLQKLARFTFAGIVFRATSFSNYRFEGEYREISAGWIKTKIRSSRRDEKELGIVLGNGLTRPARSITKEVSDS